MSALVLLAARARRPEVTIDVEQLITSYGASPWAIVEVASSEQVLTAAELLYPKVNSDSANEEWVCSDGRRMKIGDMSHEHLVHALAKIMRDARAGYHWSVERRPVSPRFGGLRRNAP